MSTTVDACLARLHRAGWSVGDPRPPLLARRRGCVERFVAGLPAAQS